MRWSQMMAILIVKVVMMMMTKMLLIPGNLDNDYVPSGMFKLRRIYSIFTTWKQFAIE